MSYLSKASLLLCTAFLLSSCLLFQSVEVGEVQGINLVQLGSRKVSLEVHIPIENNNRVNFRIIEIDMEVIINDEKLGKISNMEEVEILKNSKEVYNFPLDVEYSGANILRGALTVFSVFLERKVDVRVVGYIKVKSFLFTKKILVDENNMVILKSEVG